jgi:hypothetical protein
MAQRRIPYGPEGSEFVWPEQARQCPHVLGHEARVRGRLDALPIGEERGQVVGQANEVAVDAIV